jgi:hypothetical protein
MLARKLIANRKKPMESALKFAATECERKGHCERRSKRCNSEHGHQQVWAQKRISSRQLYMQNADEGVETVWSFIIGRLALR